MNTVANPFSETLDRLKGASPFKEFDIETADGHRYHVSGRLLFAWTETHVMVSNEKQNGIHRLPVTKVTRIAEQAAEQ